MNFGSRFSTNERIASLCAGPSAARAKLRFSYFSSFSMSCSTMWRCIISFAARTWSDGLKAISSASASVSAISSSCGTTRLTSPMRSASSGPMMRPVIESSSALAMPTICGRYTVLPASGVMPSRTKRIEKRAWSDAMRMSMLSVIVRPTPIAGPLMAAMMGLERR